MSVPCRILARLFAFVLLLMAAGAAPAAANDHMFPAAAAAKPFIDYDSRGFLVNGKRTFLVSAGMEYARVPHELWRDRLLRLKRAGFNCVEVYTFWNWHEPREGKFAFQGDHDLGAFLRLVKKMGLYAICRVGPYYCAEWDNGGYPIWLKFKPGLQVRADNKPFLDAMDRFFEKLIPVVAANQIHRGGSVVLVQLENEGAGWGTEEPNRYFTHLREKAVALGLQVPYFFSGLHHASDPAGDRSMDDPTRPNPWFSTEFWSVWYDVYGSRLQDASTYARRTWKIIAHGGNGYNYYMAHGGTNFGYTNNNEDAASYDYGTGVGQAGDLRPLYYTFKRAAWFARGFESILENALDSIPAAEGLATGPAIRVTARTGPAGTIAFLDNPGRASASTQVRIDGAPRPAAGPITLAPGEIVPVVQNFTLAPGITLKWAVTRILGVAHQGSTTTLVVYGRSGSPADLRFLAPANTRIEQGENGLRPSGAGALDLSIRFRETEPLEYRFVSGAHRVRIIAVSSQMADMTWFVEAGGQTLVICGPRYVGETGFEGGRPRFTFERPWRDGSYVIAGDARMADGTLEALRNEAALATTTGATWVFAGSGPPARVEAGPAAVQHPASLPLGAWETRSASEPASAAFNDRDWMSSASPLQMGADGDLTADAWYRTRMEVPESGQYVLHANGGDRATVFIDGARVASGRIRADLPVPLQAGSHTLAVFTAHDGRDKLFGYVGSLGGSDPKGLSGPVTMRRGTGAALGPWRVMKGVPAGAVSAGPPDAGAAGWEAYTVGDDAFGRRRGFAWFQTEIPSTAGATHVTLHFGGVDDNATVFVNGRQVGSHRGWDTSFDIPLTPGPEALLSVFVENTDNTGGLGKPVELVTQVGADVKFATWKLRGGPGRPGAPIAPDHLSPGPVFHRTTFDATPALALGAHPIWRVTTAGLGHGSVWVNGHNLGRYPEKIPIFGLYIPECWLREGPNTLVIYDEDGARPDQVTIVSEAAAGRDVGSVLLPRPAPAR